MNSNSNKNHQGRGPISQTNKRRAPSASRPAPSPSREVRSQNSTPKVNETVKRKQELKSERTQKPRSMPAHMAMYLSIGGVALLLVVCALVSLIIGVRSVEVVGADLATAEEIIAAAEIREGSGYFSYNTSESEKNILQRIHCVQEAKIDRSILGRVTVTVTEKKAVWYMEIYGRYYALSESLEVIRVAESRGEFIRRGLVRLDLPEVKSAILGRVVEFTDGDRDCSFVAELLSEVTNSNLYYEGRLNQLCIETKFGIYAVCDLKYKIILGKYSGAELKLNTARKALEKELFSGEESWELDVSDVSGVVSRPSRDADFSYLMP